MNYMTEEAIIAILLVHTLFLGMALYFILQIRLQLFELQDKANAQQIVGNRLLNDICALLNTTNKHLSEGYKPRNKKIEKQRFI